MEFTVRKKPGETDIPIATVRRTSVYSHDMIHLVDFCDQYPDNRMPVLRTLMVYPEGSGTHPNRMSVLANTNDYLVSDEFKVSPSGTMVTMWYRHSFTHSFFSNSAITRSVKRTIRNGMTSTDRVISGLIPSGESIYMLRGSVSVSYASTVVDRDRYHVDYTAGVITIASDLAVVGRTFTVSYTLVPIAITILRAEPQMYTIAVWTSGFSNSYFIVEILSETMSSFRARYMTADSSGYPCEITETTRCTPLFNLIDYNVLTARFSLSGADPELKLAAVFNGNVYVFSENTDHQYAIKTSSMNRTGIYLEVDRGLDFDSDWFARIAPGSFTVNSEDITYTYSVDPPMFPEMRREYTTILSPNVISISGQSVLYSVTQDNEILGISVTNENGQTYTVTDIDVDYRYITIDPALSLRDRVVAEYLSKTPGVRIPICMNPITASDYHSIDLYSQVVCILLAPADSSGESTVYTMTLPKFETGALINYPFSYINNLVNNTDDTARNTVRAAIDGLPADLCAAANIPLVVLGILTLKDPLDDEAYIVEDSRVFGGGIPDYNRYCYDYARYDGERVDMSSLIRISVTQDIFDDLVSRTAEWDIDTIVSDILEETARQRALEILNDTVSRFVHLGTEKEIVIG
jgi:hypothetical protein